MFDNDSVPKHRILSKTEPLSSLNLQIMLLLDKHYLSEAFFYIILILAFLKAAEFNMRHSSLECNLVGLLFLYFLNKLRLGIAIKYNKTEKTNALAVTGFVVLSLACLYGFAHFLIL